MTVQTETLRSQLANEQRRLSGEICSGDRLIKLSLAITLVFVIVDVAWLSASHIQFSPRNLIDLAQIAFSLGIALLAGMTIRWRLSNDTTRIGSFIAAQADRLTIASKFLLLYCVLGAAGSVFTYVASAAGGNLMDPALAQADQLIGFDWPAFLRFVNDRPWLSALLVSAYHSIGWMLAFTFVLLVALRREIRLMEFLALSAVTSILTGIGMALLPAAGAYVHFRPEPEHFSNMTAHAGMWHYTELMKLRSGEPFVFHAEQLKGLVTFPSYHTVWGVIIVYVLRGLTLVFAPMAVLSALMIVGTLPEGGHHLVDVLVGLLIAFAAIMLVRRFST